MRPLLQAFADGAGQLGMDTHTVWGTLLMSVVGGGGAAVDHFALRRTNA
ncbi:MAG: hypothetical protein LBU95_00550 [Rikenellaceae bacterium]|jgi:hypothetical protein|nr:hypothetical protein [Rikenellaceae bacterium]